MCNNAIVNVAAGVVSLKIDFRDATKRVSGDRTKWSWKLPGQSGL